MMFAW